VNLPLASNTTTGLKSVVFEGFEVILREPSHFTDFQNLPLRHHHHFWNEPLCPAYEEVPNPLSQQEGLRDCDEPPIEVVVGVNK